MPAENPTNLPVGEKKGHGGSKSRWQTGRLNTPPVGATGKFALHTDYARTSLAGGRLMRSIELNVTLANGLKLEDPLWIASSHFSELAMLKTWSNIGPAAITLKTATRMDRSEPWKTRKWKLKTLEMLPRYGRSYYCDAPKSEEFYPYEETKEHLDAAKELLPVHTKIGVSVLATKDENFKDLYDLTSAADFWELNLKYSMRIPSTERTFFTSLKETWDNTLKWIKDFLDALPHVPVFVKLPRESAWLPGTRECEQLLELLKTHGQAGLVVANSLKLNVADFIHETKEKQLQDGVLTGDGLYDGTINFIRLLKNDCNNRGIPIVASGGMVDEQQVLMALREGADAVQLCTAFEYYKPNYYRTLRSALQARIYWRGAKNMSNFVSRLRHEGVASIYSMPFMYYPAFWAEDVQDAIRLDIKYSDRMDAVIMSGFTLFEKWEKALQSRVSEHKSVQFMLPNPDSEIFRNVQKAWGLTDTELIARQERVKAAKANFEDLFEQELSSLKGDEIKQDWSVRYYNQCPFYSFYLFDDKVYLAQYPFLRPGKLASPVYVFFRSSPEYDRIDREWKGLQGLNSQTSLGR
jgi:dihydroorotate dehydrogenase